MDQNFTTVLSSGQEVPLCEGGESIKVTKANVDEFVQKVLEARKNEALEQVEVVRDGFIHALHKSNIAVLNFAAWRTMETRCTGEKTVDVAKLKMITTFPNCDPNHEIVDRFWRVFESMNDSQRTAYLKFVWGRSRLPIDILHLSYNHKVNLI